MGVIYTYCFNTKLTKTMLRNIIIRGHVKEEFWLIILGYSKKIIMWWVLIRSSYCRLLRYSLEWFQCWLELRFNVTVNNLSVML